MDLLVLLVGLAALLLGSWLLWLRSWLGWRRRLRALDGAKRSQSTRYGQIAEQFVPLSAAWPWDPKAFRFLGSPVDGVQFTDDAVYIVEIKTAGSRLNSQQRRIRELVESGRVAWREVRLE